MSENKQVADLANMFVSILRDWLTEDEMTQLHELNAAETDPYVCHSHDFCDANDAMLAAWESVIGGTPEFNNFDNNLWADAWGAAKEMM